MFLCALTSALVYVCVSVSGFLLFFFFFLIIDLAPLSLTPASAINTTTITANQLY